MTFIRYAHECITNARPRIFRFHIATTLLLAFACLAAPCAARTADLGDAVVFNINVQTLDKALLEFGAQAHMQIMFASTAEIGRLRAPPIRGKYTGRQALLILLRGTKFGFIYHGGTVEITPAATPPRKASLRSMALPAQPLNTTTHSRDTTLARASKTDDPPDAADTSGGGATLHEVIVTAQKYRQRALDVPISLVILDSLTLQKLQIRSQQDLQFSVPGLVVQGGGSQTRITLRGVSNLYGSGASVGEYIDDADITPASYLANFGYTQLNPGMYDLQRVEVLRGPQGTLYGDGAMGGVIRFITNKPALDSFQMNADVANLFTQYGAPSQRINAMINTPLIANTLGVRFAGEFDHEGGWIDQPAAALKNFNDENLTDLRIEALWTPAPGFAVNAMQIIHRSAYGLSINEDSNGNFAQVAGLTTTPTGNESYNLSNLTVSYRSSIAQLLSSTTYYRRNFTVNNLGYTFYDLSGFELYNPKNPYNSGGLSEELRLSSIAGGPLYWSFGGFYQNFTSGDSDPAGESFGFSAGGPLSGPYNLGYVFGSRSRSWAVFANASYEIFRRITIGAGVRYYRDRESESPGSLTANFNSTDPRFYVQYKITPRVNTYISASKGFRSGGFQSVPGIPPYEPEQLWTYELGTKLRLLDRRLDLDTAVFDSDYTNYVVLGIEPYLNSMCSCTVPTNVYKNAGAARIQGLDQSVTFRPDDLWTLALSGEYLHAYFVEINIPGAVYHAGEPLDVVPRYSFNGSVERSFHLGQKLGFVRFDYSMISRERYAESPPFVPESNVIHMLNFTGGIDWNRNLRFGVFVQNLLNDRGNLNPFYLESVGNRPRPRTLGLDFHVDFE